MPSPIPPLLAARLLKMLTITHPDEMDCEEVHDLVDEFANLVQHGKDASQLMPMVKDHLVLCTECREEYEALLRMMQE